MTKRRFFAAANTEDGFVSFFDTIFPARELDRLYLLKGGPGTGKSSLLRALAGEAEERGIPVEYYHCSSDPSSLDGVKFPTLKAAVIDATPPHAVEARLPGVCEKTVDLSEAFDLAGLRAHREDVVALATEKTLYYESAYRFLHAAGILSRELDALIAPAWLEDKADSAIRRLLRAYGIVPAEKDGRTENGVRYTDAIGTSGVVHFDTWEHMAEHIVTVTDRYGTGRAFLTRIADLCGREGIPVLRSPDVIRRDRFVSLYFPERRVLFSVLAEGEKTVNVRRFLAESAVSSVRAHGNFTERCRKTMVEGAVSSLATVGKCHAALETIYGAHTVFAVVDAAKERLSKDLFGKKEENFSK